MLLVIVIGFCIGFVGSIPIAGPIAALVLRRGLQGRPQSGLYVAWGASVAEGIYAYLAFWGFGELLGGYPWVEPVSKVAGALLVTALGAAFVLRPPDASRTERCSTGNAGMKRNLALGFTITGLNPTLLATWGAAVTMSYSVLPIEVTPTHALPFSLGAMIGVGIWFTLMLAMLQRFSDRFRPATVALVARLTGAVLLLLGLSATLRFGVHFRLD